MFELLQRASSRLDPGAVSTVALTPGITDGFFRAAGASEYGWCPLVLTAEFLAWIHGHPERVGPRTSRHSVMVMTDVVNAGVHMTVSRAGV